MLEVVNDVVNSKFRYFNVNKKVDQLDGNGCLYLALQDVSLKNGDYLRAIDNKIAQVCFLLHVKSCTFCTKFKISEM